MPPIGIPRSAQEQWRPMCGHQDRMFDQPLPLGKEGKHHPPVPAVQILMAKHDGFSFVSLFLRSSTNPNTPGMREDITPRAADPRQQPRSGEETSGTQAMEANHQYTLVCMECFSVRWHGAYQRGTMAGEAHEKIAPHREESPQNAERGASRRRECIMYPTNVWIYSSSARRYPWKYDT